MITKPAERKSGHAAQSLSPDMATADAETDKTMVQPPELSPPAPRSRGWMWWVLLAVVAGIAWWFRLTWLPWVSIDRKGAAKPEPRPIPVRVAAAVERDLPLFLDQLGTVTPQNTVTIRSRVDGELLHLYFQEGELVSEGKVLAEIDPRSYKAALQQAQGQQARDEASLKLAQMTVARSRDLLKAKSISQQIVDDQAAQVMQFEAALKADAGTVANAKLQVEYCTITAPISGRVGLQLVDPGNMIRASDQVGLAVITQLQPITVVFTIPQDEIPRVLRNHSAANPLVVEAFNRDFKTKLASGKLTALDNQIDQATGTLRLKATFDNKEGMLFPNQFVNARLLVETRSKAIVVPTAAVQRGPNGTYAYVVKDEKVKNRAIKAGPSEGGETIVESGLQKGEIVVVDGVDKLQNDTKVSVRESDKEGSKSKKKGQGKDGGQSKESDKSPGRTKTADKQPTS